MLVMLVRLVHLGAQRLGVDARDLVEDHECIEIDAMTAGMIADRCGAAPRQRVAVPKIDLLAGMARQVRVLDRNAEIDGTYPSITGEGDVDVGAGRIGG